MSVIKFETISATGKSKTVIDIPTLPESLKCRIIQAAMVVSLFVGNGEILAEGGDPEADRALDDLCAALKAMEHAGEVSH